MTAGTLFAFLLVLPVSAVKPPHGGTGWDHSKFRDIDLQRLIAYDEKDGASAKTEDEAYLERHGMHHKDAMDGIFAIMQNEEEKTEDENKNNDDIFPDGSYAKMTPAQRHQRMELATQQEQEASDAEAAEGNREIAEGGEEAPPVGADEEEDDNPDEAALNGQTAAERDQANTEKSKINDILARSKNFESRFGSKSSGEDADAAPEPVRDPEHDESREEREWHAAHRAHRSQHLRAKVQRAHHLAHTARRAHHARARLATERRSRASSFAEGEKSPFGNLDGVEDVLHQLTHRFQSEAAAATADAKLTDFAGMAPSSFEERRSSASAGQRTEDELPIALSGDIVSARDDMSQVQDQLKSLQDRLGDHLKKFSREMQTGDFGSFLQITSQARALARAAARATSHASFIQIKSQARALSTAAAAATMRSEASAMAQAADEPSLDLEHQNGWHPQAEVDADFKKMIDHMKAEPAKFKAQADEFQEHLKKREEEFHKKFLARRKVLSFLREDESGADAAASADGAAGEKAPSGPAAPSALLEERALKDRAGDLAGEGEYEGDRAGDFLGAFAAEQVRRGDPAFADLAAATARVKDLKKKLHGDEVRLAKAAHDATARWAAPPRRSAPELRALEQVGARLKDNLRGDRDAGADTPPSSLAETGAEAKVNPALLGAVPSIVVLNGMPRVIPGNVPVSPVVLAASQGIEDAQASFQSRIQSSLDRYHRAVAKARKRGIFGAPDEPPVPSLSHDAELYVPSVHSDSTGGISLLETGGAAPEPASAAAAPDAPAQSKPDEAETELEAAVTRARNVRLRLLKDAEKSGAQGEKFKEEAEKRLAAFEKRFPVHEPTHKDPVLENEIKDAFGDLDDTLDKKDQIEEGKADIRDRDDGPAADDLDDDDKGKKESEDSLLQTGERFHGDEDNEADAVVADSDDGDDDQDPPPRMNTGLNDFKKGIDGLESLRDNLAAHEREYKRKVRDDKARIAAEEERFSRQTAEKERGDGASFLEREKKPETLNEVRERMDAKKLNAELGGDSDNILAKETSLLQHAADPLKEEQQKLDSLMKHVDVEMTESSSEA